MHRRPWGRNKLKGKSSVEEEGEGECTGLAGMSEEGIGKLSASEADKMLIFLGGYSEELGSLSLMSSIRIIICGCPGSSTIMIGLEGGPEGICDKSI